MPHPAPSIDAQLARIHRELAALTPAEHGVVHDATTQPVAPTGHGHLDGMVLFVKDLSDVAGMPTSYGSIHRRHIPRSHDHVNEWLLKQGATIAGKSATSEMGMTAYTEPVGQPAIRNPLWPGRTPGGSSGGAAALVARGIVDVAHASDGGGSIRVPAAACGLVGFKPPHTPGEGRLTAQGFLTTSVRRAAALHGFRPHPRRLRIAVLRAPLHGDGEVDPIMLSALADATKQLRAHGHEIIPVDPAYGPEPFAAFQTLMWHKSSRIPGPASPIVEYMRERGRDLAPGALEEALRTLAALDRHVRYAWPCELLLTPTLAYDPPPIGTFSSLEPQDDFDEQTRWTPWGSLFNITGRAAISVPWSLPGRPPVGLHLGCIHTGPAELLGVAEQLEAAGAPKGEEA
ncbi:MULTISPECIES: amidase [unclassified Corynebacterium]|uniref:amidase n=1 Tax=unclassified Corynebacterium TaxID=2624378 RepID=UPI001C44E4D3|nr:MULTISPECIES: amidase [unclassified Corynebacterium]MBV7282193.1 amidase [Corynebacterium sp. TAE3-ERU30]MBV7302466.1 amidase [Corynebacterium sp. TAE3-ERU2]